MDSFTYNNVDRHVLCICKTTEEMAFTMTSLYEKKNEYYMLQHYRENSYRKNNEGDRNIKFFIYEDVRNFCYR